MAEKLAVRLRTLLYLAPFGGITRIRFKGFVQDVSAVSAPPLYFKKDKGRNKNYKGEWSRRQASDMDEARRVGESGASE